MRYQRLLNIFKRILPITFLIMIGVMSPITFALHCTSGEKICVAGKAVKNIDGVEVALDCWAYQTMKTCVSDTPDTCQTLDRQGCTQKTAHCIEVVDGTCLAQAEGYVCTTQACTQTDMRVQERYCKNGDCIDHDSDQSSDFKTTIAEFASIVSAGDDVSNRQTDQLFQGQAMECSENMVGYKNCCTDSGWGKDLALAHCTDQERALGEKKEAGLSVYVGRYCHHRLDYGAGSVCTSHHQVYCVFDHQIAQIIQAQGRFKQLHLSFGQVDGDTASPDCRAITVEELSQLDLTQMDFSALYDALEKKTHFPDSNRIESHLISRIQQLYADGATHAH